MDIKDFNDTELNNELELIIREIQNRGYKTFCLISKHNTTDQEFNEFIWMEFLKMKEVKQ